jgi:glycosyltransferase involved in cell wall biosynthesis
MRIIHIISALPFGGAESSLFNLVSEDVTSENEHIVISLTSKGDLGEKMTDKGIKVITIGVKSLPHSVLKLPVLFNSIRSLKPDIIQGWMYQGNFVAWISRAFFYPKSSLIWCVRHSLYDIKKEKWMIRLVININKHLSNKPDFIVYNSKTSMIQHEKFKFSNKQSVVIDNGFDTQKFYPSRSIGLAVRKKLNISKDQIIFAHFGRFHPMKNHKGFLLAAIEILKINSQAHFLMAGQGVDEDNHELINIIPNNFLSSFTMLGPRNDIDELMKAVDFLCVSSLWGEGFPNVICESMASGNYCISTNIGESAYIIGSNGIVVDLNTKDELFNAMKEVLSISIDERKIVGDLSRKRVESHFSLRRMIENFQDLYIASV